MAIICNDCKPQSLTGGSNDYSRFVYDKLYKYTLGVVIKTVPFYSVNCLQGSKYLCVTRLT